MRVDDYNVKNEILDFNLKKDSISLQLDAEKIKVKRMKEQINRDLQQLPKQYKAYIIGLLLGLAMMGFGFYFWYVKTQIFNDLILKNESNNLKHNKEVSIHKLQFEKEFLIYDKLWKSLVELRTNTALLRPQAEVINTTKSEEEIRKEKLNNIDLAFRNCVNIYEDNKPFYPKDIYEEIRSTIKITNKEIIQFVRGESYTDEYWNTGEKNITKIINSIDVVCEKMRERIGLVKIEG
ncbi:hypothetical protein [Flavobacterium sp. ACN2]|uniref:hypothetical protein n=1 Tax=Flavobacterium sp. ACN2 TaxID=1975676 RepID=UPI001555F91C|nr:hypothetical protein [Flavobacterium sp. ACN2]